MPVSTKSITDYIDGCLATSPTDQELAQMAGAITSIEAGDKFSVACTALLPDVAENIGRWVYVTDISAYRYSNGTEWTNSYNTACRIENNIWGVGANNFGQLATGSVDASQTYSTIVRESSNSQWSQIAGGGNFIAAIKNNGTVWSWGSGAIFATHGDGTTYGITYSSPVQEMCSSTDWCFLDRESSHTAAIKSDGSLWSWGINSIGQQLIGFCQFGTGSCSPIQEYTSSSWSKVKIGNGNVTVYGIKSDSSLWVGGSNFCGKAGTNSITCYSSPVQEISSSSWVDVDASVSHAIAIKTDGTLWGWGNNNCGQVGNGTIINHSSPVQEISSSSSWCLVSTGCCNSFSIKTDGTLWAWGWGQFGGLANGSNSGVGATTSSPVQEISSSTNWCYANTGGSSIILGRAIKTDGSLWGWGCWVRYSFGEEFGESGLRSSPVCLNLGSNDWYQIAGTSCATIGIRSQIIGFNEP